MLNWSFRCAQQRQAIAALGPAGGGGGGEHSLLGISLIQTENCKRNEDLFAAAFPSLLMLGKENGNQQPAARPATGPIAVAETCWRIH